MKADLRQQSININVLFSDCGSWIYHNFVTQNVVYGSKALDYLGVCWKCRISGSNPDLFYYKLHFGKMWFLCTLKSEITDDSILHYYSSWQKLAHSCHLLLSLPTPSRIHCNASLPGNSKPWPFISIQTFDTLCFLWILISLVVYFI